MKGPTALTEVERAAIEAHGLYDLKEFLPKMPSDSELRIIKDMFEASVDGRLYDPDKWGAYFKPWGLQVAGGNSYDDDDIPDISVPAQPKISVAASKPVAKPQVSESTPPWEDEPEASNNDVKVVEKPAVSAKTQDILAVIRSRQNKAA
jgi:hypothetical protein